MKKIIISATAAIIMLSASCGQSQQPKKTVSVPDNLLIVPGARAGDIVLNQNGAGDEITIDDANYRTAENTGVGSTLQELTDVYQNCILNIEGDVTPYKSADEMLKMYLPDGLNDDHYVRLTCLNADGKETGIAFSLTLKKSDSPEQVKKQSKAYQVSVYDTGSSQLGGTAALHISADGNYEAHQAPFALAPAKIGEFARPYSDDEEGDAYMFHPDPNGKYYHFEEFVTGGDSQWDAIWRYEEKFTATSSLSPSGNTRYDAENLRNDKSRNEGGGDRSVAWCEGAKGYGIGERVSMSVITKGACSENDDEVRFWQLMIVNGYARNETTWKNNTRVKVLRLYVGDRRWCDLLLADVIKPQIFTFPDDLQIYITKYGKKIPEEGAFSKPFDYSEFDGSSC